MFMSETEPAADTESPVGESTPADDRRLQLELRRRQLFAQAQELFAVGEFEAARDALERVPGQYRTDDMQRLLGLVEERLLEVAEIRRDVEAEHNGRPREERLRKVRRWLELRPGDERAVELLHRLEEDDDDLFADVEVVPTPQHAAPRSKPPAGEAARRRGRQARTEAEAVPVEVVDDDVFPDDDVWEFGERLAASAPPRRRRRRPRRERADAGEFDGPVSQTAVWIAVGVCGMVVLLAIVVTLIVLMVEGT